MKAKLKVDANLIIEVEGEEYAEVFKGISFAQEIFEHNKCGKCGCQKLRYKVRKDDEENEYYEIHCTNFDCRARLPFGQMKKPKGQLYPKVRWDSLSAGEQEKRKEEESYAHSHAGFLPHNGWYVYKPNKKEETK